MKRSLFSLAAALVSAGLLICLALTTAGSTVQAAADVEAGKAVFAKKCKACHAAGGEGNAAIAKTMQVTLRHLGAKEVQQKKDDELKKDVVEGTGKMKPAKDLSPADVANLIGFLRTLKGN